MKTYFSPGTSTFPLIVSCESTGWRKHIGEVRGGEDDHDTRIFLARAVALFTEPSSGGAVEDTVGGSGVATFTTGTGSFTATRWWRTSQ